MRYVVCERFKHGIFHTIFYNREEAEKRACEIAVNRKGHVCVYVCDEYGNIISGTDFQMSIMFRQESE